MRQPTPEMDIVERAKAISPDISDYFEEQRYKKFTDEVQQEEITDRYLLNVAIELLLGELKDIGIESDHTADDIIEDPHLLKTMFALRTKFDQSTLHQTLSHLSEKTLSEFRGVYEAIELPEDLLLELGPWFARTFPSDENWLAVESSIETWYSTRAFANHLTTVLSVLSTDDPSPTPVTDDVVDAVSVFLKKMQIRQEKILDLATEIVKLFPEVNMDLLRMKIEKYDIQKLDGDNLRKFATYVEDGSLEEPDFVVHHHRTVDHHVEYWQEKASRLANGASLGYTRENAVMVVLSLVLDGMSKTAMHQAIQPLQGILEPYLYTFTRALTDVDYAQFQPKEAQP